jgi:hypothetical protein
MPIGGDQGIDQVDEATVHALGLSKHAPCLNPKRRAIALLRSLSTAALISTRFSLHESKACSVSAVPVDAEQLRVLRAHADGSTVTTSREG